MIGLLPAGWFSHLDAQKWGEIAIALKDTLVMLGLAFPLTLAVGIPLGLVLFLTGRQQPGARPVLNAIVAFVVNVLRSVPFILLMICLIPSRCGWPARRWASRAPSCRWWWAPRRSTRAWWNRP